MVVTEGDFQLKLAHFLVLSFRDKGTLQPSDFDSEITLSLSRADAVWSLGRIVSEHPTRVHVGCVRNLSFHGKNECVRGKEQNRDVHHL